MKKRANEAQKFLSCLDAIIVRKSEKRAGETNSRYRDILKIELAELKSIRSLFISIFKIKPKEPPDQLPLIEEKLSEGTNKPERKVAKHLNSVSITK